MLATPEGVAAAALTQWQPRGDRSTHRYVLGGFRLMQGQIVLVAVAMGPGMDILRPIVLTEVEAAMYRWATRQAADQFAKRWGVSDVHVVDLGWLDVLPGLLTPLDGPPPKTDMFF